MKKKRIIVFSKNLKIGGMEKALLLLLNQLVKDYQVKLVLEENEGILLKQLSQEIELEEYKLSTSSNVMIRKMKNFIKRFFWQIRNYHKYDFSCNYATYSIIGSKLAQIASKNSSLYIHSNYYDVYHHNKKEIDFFFNPHKLFKFQTIICVSNESKNGLAQIYPKLIEKMIVINNLFECNFLTEHSKEEAQKIIKSSNVNFIFVGRLDNESKNLKLLLEVFYEISQKNSIYKLYIVGDGPYKKEMEKFILEKQLENTIFLLGEKEDPYSYMQMSDCLILTSNYEGFPVVYLEALALNIKIMTTVITSDDCINMKDYCISLKKDKDDIVEKILAFKKETINYQINLNLLNEQRIEKIKKVIEEEV